MDVHPPDHAINSWRDFFIHMATICLGLVIALGLEQTVEAVHHAHQRRELRANLHRESRRIFIESEGDVQHSMAWLQWDDQRIAQLRVAISQNRPLAAPPPFPHLAAGIFRPEDPAWQAAETSSLAPLLTENEVNAYIEIDSEIAAREKTVSHAMKENNALQQFEASLFPPQGSDPDFSHASQETLRRELILLLAVRSSGQDYLFDCRTLVGAETAVLAGHLDFDQIEAAEEKEIRRP